MVAAAINAALDGRDRRTDQSFFAPVMSPAMVGNESDSRAPNANENMDTFIVCSFN